MQRGVLEEVPSHIRIWIETSERIAHFEIRVARWRVLLVVLEAVQVLVSLAADLALVGLLLFHADRAGIRDRSHRIND